MTTRYEERQLAKANAQARADEILEVQNIIANAQVASGWRIIKALFKIALFILFLYVLFIGGVIYLAANSTPTPIQHTNCVAPDGTLRC